MTVFFALHAHGLFEALKGGDMVTIRVTGHRFLAELDRINTRVEQALRRIEQAFPGQPLTAISSLAEGADRLVAYHILAHPRAQLAVPLPLPKEDIWPTSNRQSRRQNS